MPLISIIGFVLATLVAVTPAQDDDSLVQINAVGINRYATGDGVLVAVLDTGLEASHVHFDGLNIQTYNALDGSTNVSENCKHHGTIVAGITSKIATEMDMLFIKIFGETCGGTFDGMAAGVIYAVDHGARIILICAGGTFAGPLIGEALDYAASQDVLVIVAAGNNNSDGPFPPATHPTAMAVSGINDAGGRYVGSNFGDHISVSAPAETVYAPVSIEGEQDRYAYASETSVSAPLVAGVAALLLELDPELSALELRQAIENASVDIGDAGHDPYFGHGKLDALAAVREVGDFLDTRLPYVTSGD